MSDEQGGTSNGPYDRPQDPLVARRRPDPSQPVAAYRTLQGFWGDSDRAGFRRLYLTAALTSYAEFRLDDVVSTSDIPADASPFPGEPATRVVLPAAAAVDYTRSRSAAADPFDLDVRLGGRPPAADVGAFDPSEDPMGCLAPGTGGDDTCQETCFGCPNPTHPDTACVCPTDPDTCFTCPGDTCPTGETCTCDGC